MFTDALLIFAQDNALLLIVAVVVIIIVVSIIKTIIRWIIALMIVIGLVFLVLNYDIPEEGIGERLIAEAVSTEHRELITDLVNQGSTASYKSTGNGGYIIAAGGIVLEGSDNTDTVTLTKGSVTIELHKSKIVQTYIDRVRQKETAQID